MLGLTGYFVRTNVAKFSFNISMTRFSNVLMFSRYCFTFAAEALNLSQFSG
jgi:hypothetical protein